MRKLLFVAVAFAGLTLVSCNKDQAAVKKLDGTWNVTKSESTTGALTINNLDFVEAISMSFTECKLKSENWCTGSTSVTVLGLTSTDNQVYRVTGDGLTLEVKESDTSSTISTMTIDELTKTSLKTTWVDGSTTTVSEATKQ